MTRRFSRRRLLVGVASVGAGILILPHASARSYRANEKANVATLFDREIEYDPIAGKCVGDDEATAALERTYRERWTL